LSGQHVPRRTNEFPSLVAVFVALLHEIGDALGNSPLGPPKDLIKPNIKEVLQFLQSKSARTCSA